MKKMELSFDGGYDTIMLDLSTGALKSFEFGEIPEAVTTHTSRSGCTGEGHVALRPDSSLFPVGAYRTDTGWSHAWLHAWYGEPIFRPKSGGRDVYILAPFANHTSEHGSPVVVTNKRDFVAFTWGGLPLKELLEAIFNGRLEGGKEIRIPWFEPGDTSPSYRVVKFYNPYHIGGQNILRFLDLGLDTLEHWSDDPEYDELGIIGHYTHLHRWGDHLYHVGKNGLLDQHFDLADLDKEGVELPGGVMTLGNRLFLARRGTEVTLFFCGKRAALENGRYAMPDGSLEEFDFELSFQAAEFFLAQEACVGEFIAQSRRKLRQDWLWKARELRQMQPIDREILERCAETRVSIQDSLDAGNCRPGTDEFVRHFGIKLDADGATTIGALLANEHLDEMLKNYMFRKTLDIVVGEEVRDAAEELLVDELRAQEA